jgi:hypothetical protein
MSIYPVLQHLKTEIIQFDLIYKNTKTCKSYDL